LECTTGLDIRRKQWKLRLDAVVSRIGYFVLKKITF